MAWRLKKTTKQYSDIIRSAMAYLVTGVPTVYSYRLFRRRRSKKTTKLRVTGLWMGDSPATGNLPAERASNAENVTLIASSLKNTLVNNQCGFSNFLEYHSLRSHVIRNLFWFRYHVAPRKLWATHEAMGTHSVTCVCSSRLMNSNCHVQSKILSLV